MGIVARQSIKNFFWSNIGILVGALYTFLIIPRVFEENPAQWGLIQLIIYYNQILLPITLLSIPTVIIKFFPSFKKEGKSNELYSLSLIIVTTTVVLVAALFVVFRKYLFADEEGIENMTRYILLVVPILLFSSIFEVLAAWSKVNLKSTVPNFLKDSFLKIWNFLVVLIFYFQLISFDTLIILYFVIYAAQAGLMLFYLKKHETIAFKFSKSTLRSTFKKEHLSFMIFGIMGTAAFTLMNKVDVIMIGKMLSLNEVAFYSIGLALVAFVVLPEKSISAISVPTLSHLLEKNDLVGIHTLYKKTSINQLVISSYIFIGIWINMPSISAYLGPKFGNIEYVVLFLGLAKIVDVFTGLNGPLIGISKYYRSALVMQLILVVIVIISNLVFIPRYGINGAAFASFISVSLYNTIKTVFVYSKYKIWPFSIKSLLAILIGLLAITVNRFIPEFEGIIVDVIIRSIIFSILFIGLILWLTISEDLNVLFRNIMARTKNKSSKHS